MAYMHRLLLAGLASLAAAHAGAQVQPSSAAQPSCEQRELAQRLAASAAGYLRAVQAGDELPWPLAERPPAGDLVVQSSEPDPLVHDGFTYHVAADHRTGEVWVIRTGGYAGVREFYGPVGRLAVSGVCAVSTPAANVAAKPGADIVGGRSGTYEREPHRARAAGAVVGVDCDYEVLGPGQRHADGFGQRHGGGAGAARPAPPHRA
ncbi:hypothetical protein IWX58_002291 [Rubrivivax gelatinosus]|nr:hypothetical protein [Rubrivivax gelatinosus]